VLCRSAHSKGSRSRALRLEEPTFGVVESEKYTFIKGRIEKHPILLICSVLEVNGSGFYAWLHEPKSKRAKDDVLPKALEDNYFKKLASA